MNLWTLNARTTLNKVVVVQVKYKPLCIVYIPRGFVLKGIKCGSLSLREVILRVYIFLNQTPQSKRARRGNTHQGKEIFFLVCFKLFLCIEPLNPIIPIVNFLLHA